MPDRPIAVFLAGAMLVVAAATSGATEAGTAAPSGFGNIPFGSSKDKALELNAGNGTLSNNPDKTATLSYNVLVAGLNFSVAQNFDTDGRATDATLTYSSREDATTCVQRLNYVLTHVTRRYGRPTTPVVSRREDAGSSRTDYYTLEFAFANRAGIKAEAQATYPAPAKAGAGTTGGAPAAGGISSCQVTLQYLPPRWIGRF